MPDDTRTRFEELRSAELADPADLDALMNGKLGLAFGVDDLYYFWLEREA